MTVEQLKSWLTEWVVKVTDLPVEEVSENKPLEALGLSSRDAVILSGELETLLDTRLDPTIAYEYPTIASLAQRLVDGPAEGSARASAAQQSYERADVAGAANGARGGAGAFGGDIAIVGMSARFPQADGLDEYWQLLAEGRTATGELPLGRWSEYESDPVMSEKMGKINLSGGYLDDIASFDPEFFGLSPIEATNMDPQQRIMLELTWHALENAHLPANELKGTSVGVFMGSSNNDYGMLITADPAEAHPYALTGTSSAVIPNRISYAFDFRGPSLNVDTACSSSLVSVHQAVRELRYGSCDVAVAGGVNILASPFVSTAFGELGVISPSGAIHAFSDDADGFVRADGAGVVVLKRLADAEAAGDEILAVIKGSATNSDGHSNGLTAPNPEAQIDVLRRAYADAGIDPATVDYVETHGTGTILGDPIEASALGAVLGPRRETDTLIGSVKSNIGHSESAAGIASLIKVVLAIQNDTLPPSVNFSEPNRYIDFEKERLEVVEDPREWPSDNKIAGISGFGFGGTNAHVVVQKYDAAATAQDAAADVAVATETQPRLNSDNVVLPISGMVPSRRRQAAGDLADYLEQAQDNKDFALTAVARTLAKRNHGRSRAAVVAADAAEAIKRLRKLAEGKAATAAVSGDAPESPGPVFVYSGFGSQHRKMVKDLLEQSPQFAARMAELDEIVDFEGGWSVLELVRDDEQTYNTETAQVAITAIQIALTDLLAQCGARPAAVIGMSMGEIAAAYAAGGLRAEDAMLIACHRARLMGEGENALTDDAQGAMAVVELSAQQIADYAEQEEFAGVEPAVYAGPGMTTVGGPRAAILRLVDKLEDEGKFARALDVKGAGHTSMVEPLLGELEAAIAGIEPAPLHTPLFSSVDQIHHQRGAVVHNEDYWLHMTRQPVHFQDAVASAFAHGHNTMVEISPNPVALMGMMNTAFSVDKANAKLLKTLKRKEDSANNLVDLLAQLYVLGQPVDFSQLYGSGEYAAVPNTRFKKQRYWTNARPSAGAAGLPGTRVNLPDGRTAFSVDADQVPSTLALLEAAAEAMQPGAQLVAVEEPRTLPPQGELTTIAQRNVGGVALTVHDMAAGVVVAEGFATTLALADGGGGAHAQSQNLGVAPIPESPLAAGAAAGTNDAAAGNNLGMPGADSAVRWDPETETVEERLRAIVSESMGYDAEDLPGELPLIDLGLDSLMGMRIKNRVENDFQIPPLQVQALRDASVADVVAMVNQAVAEKHGSAGHTSAEQSSTEQSDQPEQAQQPEQSYATQAEGVGVAPRDAAERLVFATWASLTGRAAAGVTSTLPEINSEVAGKIAERLSERSGMSIGAELVGKAENLEEIANVVREGLETDVEGNIRVLREGSDDAPVVFMFHPAGGSSVVYQPLARRLPQEVSVYGVERREGSLEERVADYLGDIRKYAKGRPVILGGWSFGGALAYEAASQLLADDSTHGIDLAYIALLDTTQPSEPIPDTLDETKARWERYAAFAERTYGLDFPVPYELLETAGEEALMQMLEQFLASSDASEHGLSAGVLEHQRASFVDNMILGKLDFARWADVDLPVLLFRAERMHDGAIELEPRYADIDPDGGWGAIVDELEIVQLPGDHLAVPDEPAIGIVAEHMDRWMKSKIPAAREEH
ncbi:alpha/beta fold hydrolase [Corynebacterium propinquum]|uniref:polyketide synthase Pks13 n=1 Tax=Corynebacterium propinquum TaxID=43769 RepID=UPI000F862371|nr:polyketide synthase Pks13 [Corynebacterium propinquum]MCT1819318.1 polyketide synthase Pks13 [Corynebacterium propinquum]MDK4282543.1 polyketide synthase Pks13 [Corynebacterium propinquum]RUP76686.1 alpha/beta fold hydrolase [Corynebacterium propinquum]RUP87757.1 alpha/beta fold hydrolase [Corynebacterium propinquum]RUP92738.1 alpha/beta fold hydrolase [Corynebacterium propinquum]